MRSKVSIAGHPLHAALVALPIGLLVWAFVADIIYVATGKDQAWYGISFYSGIAGILTAMLAAVTGFADYLILVKGTRVNDIALLHLGTNMLAVSLFLVAAALQVEGNARDGSSLSAVIALHASGATFLAMAGWLGGEMVSWDRVATLETKPSGETEASQRRSAGRTQQRGA